MTRIVASIDPLTRAIFLANCIDETPYGDIAQRLGISVDEVERRMASAICTIAKRLEDVEADRRA